MPFIPFQYIASTSSGVNEEDGTVVQGESCQVRATSGEGLEAALGGVDLWDGSNDEKVGGKNKHDESDDIGDKYKIEYSLVAILHITGKLSKGNRSRKKSSMIFLPQKLRVNVLLVMITELIKPLTYEVATRLYITLGTRPGNKARG